MNAMQALMTGALLAACATAAGQDCSNIAGDWTGTYSETDCFGAPYSGDWTAVVTNSCEFTGEADFETVDGTIDPMTGILTASGQSQECGILSLTATFQDTTMSGSYTYSSGGDGTVSGNKQIVDTDGDGDPDATDPDDDNDGIGDVFDDQPLNANNFCSELDPQNVTFQQVVTGDLSCAAEVSISVVPLSQVLAAGNLRLIAPTVTFQDGFNVAGALTVISSHPCPACVP